MSSEWILPNNSLSSLIFSLFQDPPEVGERKAANHTKYLTVLIILTVFTFLMVLFQAWVAIKAYKLLMQKDRILLYHFVFLEITLVLKIYTLI
jgi:hypothetical protein